MGAPTILLVEDDADDAFLFERALRKSQVAAQLRVVEDGEKAVAYLTGQGPYADRERNPLPTLIILDLKLPRMGGRELLTWVRQQAQLKRLPVVVLTSSTEPADITRAYDLGASSYLAKPLGAEALLDLVHLLCRYWLQANEPPTLR